MRMNLQTRDSDESDERRWFEKGTPEFITVGGTTLGRARYEPRWQQSILRGRRREQDTLDGLVARARSGRSGVLVVRGEAGIGKTALLEYLVERASGCAVARATGVQADTELAFAGLQHLFGSKLGSLSRYSEYRKPASRTMPTAMLDQTCQRFQPPW